MSGSCWRGARRRPTNRCRFGLPGCRLIAHPTRRRPASLDDTGALLRRHLGLKLSRPVLARLQAISGGTPFYAIELGHDLQLRGAWATPESLEVPRSLDRLVGARVDALDPAADEVALYAAALAHPTTSVLDAALGSDRTAAGLEGAVAANVLAVDGDGVRFVHPLLAAAAYGRASPGRRRSVHERLAEVVTEPEERARHLSRAVGRAPMSRSRGRSRMGRLCRPSRGIGGGGRAG